MLNFFVPERLEKVAVGSKIEYRNIAGVSFKGVFTGFSKVGGDKVFTLKDGKTGKEATLTPLSLVLVLS